MGRDKKLAPADPARAVCDVGTYIVGLTAIASGALAASTMAHRNGMVYSDQVTLWDGASGAPLGRFGTGRGCVCWQAALSPDGRLVAAGFGDLTFRVWDARTGEERLCEKLGGIVASVTWSDDGRFVFTGNCGDHTVRLWDVTAGAVVAQRRLKRSIMWFTSMAGDARRAASGNADKLVHLWDPREAVELAPLAGHTGKILGLAFSRDGRRLVSASADKTARVWDVAEARCLATLVGHTGQVSAVCFTDDGAVVTSSADSTVRVWRGDACDDVRVFHLGSVKADGVASTGGEVFAGCSDGVIRAFAL